MQFYKVSDMVEARKLDSGTRYRVNIIWFQNDWTHEDGTKVKGSDIWGKTKPCIPGSLYCKCCKKQVQYGNRGAKALETHITRGSHKQNLREFMDQSQHTLDSTFFQDGDETEGHGRVSEVKIK